jgi:hypothetical protein
MSIWEPTHAVGNEVIAVWATPDPAQPSVAQLEPGRAVVVGEVRGAWAEVVLENGFRGWVDASRLVARASPVGPPPMMSPAQRSRTAPIAIGAVIIVGLVVAAFLLTRSDSKKNTATSTSSSDATEQSTSSSPASDGVVRYKVPDGWSISDDGLTIAEDKADLTASAPSGPRISAVIGAGEDDAIALMNDTITDASFDIIEEPTEVQVSGVAAVSVTLRKDNVVVRFIGTHPIDGDGVVFTVQCPVERFEELQADLEAAPGLKT